VYSAAFFGSYDLEHPRAICRAAAGLGGHPCVAQELNLRRVRLHAVTNGVRGRTSPHRGSMGGVECRLGQARKADCVTVLFMARRHKRRPMAHVAVVASAPAHANAFPNSSTFPGVVAYFLQRRAYAHTIKASPTLIRSRGSDIAARRVLNFDSADPPID
jgi:hypothetical protein